MDRRASQYVVLDERLVSSFRSAAVAFDHSETGAPGVSPSTPLDLHGAGTCDGAAALEVFLRFGEMEPGPRSFPNPHVEDVDGEPQDWFGLGTVMVDVTAEHLAVLRELVSDAAPRGAAPFVDPKRPLGSSDPMRDLKELLTGARSAATEEESERLGRLWAEMPAVMQAFFREARIRTGLYGGVPAHTGWSFLRERTPERTPAAAVA